MEFEKIRNLIIGVEYSIDRIKLVKTKYGESLLVHTMEFDCFLPKSWNSKLSQEDLNMINKACPWVYLVYKGKIYFPDGKFKYDIEIKRA